MSSYVEIVAFISDFRYFLPGLLVDAVGRLVLLTKLRLLFGETRIEIRVALLLRQPDSRPAFPQSDGKDNGHGKPPENVEQAR